MLPVFAAAFSRRYATGGCWARTHGVETPCYCHSVADATGSISTSDHFAGLFWQFTIVGMRGVLLISDPAARQKPCLRCGYSLCHIPSARNCPECGLAVRISLSNNRSLEWSNPTWLRKLATGILLIAVAHLLLTGGWLIDVFLEWGWLAAPVSSLETLDLIRWSMVQTERLATIIGLLLLATPERRYPEGARGLRLTLAGASTALAVLAITRAVFLRPTMLAGMPEWFWDYGYPVAFGEWQLPARDVLVQLYVAYLLQRSSFRLFGQIFGFAFAPVLISYILWAADSTYLMWWVHPLLWLGVYAPGAAALLLWGCFLVLRCAREASSNWQSDL